MYIYICVCVILSKEYIYIWCVCVYNSLHGIFFLLITKYTCKTNKITFIGLNLANIEGKEYKSKGTTKTRHMSFLNIITTLLNDLLSTQTNNFFELTVGDRISL